MTTSYQTSGWDRTILWIIKNILHFFEKKGGELDFHKIAGYTCNRHQLTTEFFRDSLRKLGYYVDYSILNALDYGLPQKRERIFIVGYHRNINFEWPRKCLKMKPLAEILEKNIDKKYFASEYIRTKRKKAHNPLVTPSIWHENKSGNISSYPYSCALRAGASYNYLLVNGERRLTPREMLRLQGFPDWYKIAVPYTQIRKQAGNAVPVNLVYAVFNSLIKFLKEDILKDREKNYGTSEIPAFAEC